MTRLLQPGAPERTSYAGRSLVGGGSYLQRRRFDLLGAASHFTARSGEVAYTPPTAARARRLSLQAALVAKVPLRHDREGRRWRGQQDRRQPIREHAAAEHLLTSAVRQATGVIVGAHADATSVADPVLHRSYSPISLTAS